MVPGLSARARRARSQGGKLVPHSLRNTLGAIFVKHFYHRRWVFRPRTRRFPSSTRVSLHPCGGFAPEGVISALRKEERHLKV